MKTIKVIDLLNKIANGEEVPKHIRVMNNDYYFNKNDGIYYLEYTSCELISNITYFSELNDEVEIIEEDKEIEKISNDIPCSYEIETILRDKLNEVIDIVNELNKED